MALHGRSVGQPAARPAPLPAVHSRASPSPPAVSLERPRPGTARAANLYSLAPEPADRARADRSEAERLAARGRPPPTAKRAGRGQHGHHGEHGEHGGRREPSRGGAGAEKASAGRARLQDAAPEKRPVREQPGSLKKPSCAGSGDAGSEPAEDSIVCAACGRCRCEACCAPRPLPQRLLCGRTCLLSVDTCVDLASCMCCVKAAAYHCAASDSGSRAADRPCSCAPAGGGCCLRWTALLLLTALMPCLACYWPLRAAARLAQVCYARGEGCACPPPQPRDAGSVARRADRPAVVDPPRLCARD